MKLDLVVGDVVMFKMKVKSDATIDSMHGSTFWYWIHAMSYSKSKQITRFYRTRCTLGRWPTMLQNIEKLDCFKSMAYIHGARIGNILIYNLYAHDTHALYSFTWITEDFFSFDISYWFKVCMLLVFRHLICWWHNHIVIAVLSTCNNLQKNNCSWISLK